MSHAIKKNEIIKKIESLSVIDKLNIVTDVWEEIKESEELHNVTKEQKKLLMDRLAKYNINPELAVDWSLLKQEVYDNQSL